MLASLSVLDNDNFPGGCSSLYSHQVWDWYGWTLRSLPFWRVWSCLLLWFCFLFSQLLMNLHIFSCNLFAILVFSSRKCLFIFLLVFPLNVFIDFFGVLYIVSIQSFKKYIYIWPIFPFTVWFFFLLSFCVFWWVNVYSYVCISSESNADLFLLSSLYLLFLHFP